MKTDETKSLKAMKTGSELVAILVFSFVIIFVHSAAIIGISGTVLLSIEFWLRPELYGDRSGSPTPMYWLLAVLWCACILAFLAQMFSVVE